MANEGAEGFIFQCPVRRCGFKSTGWATEELATLRGRQHQHEHETGEPMPELSEFLLMVNDGVTETHEEDEG